MSDSTANERSERSPTKAGRIADELREIIASGQIERGTRLHQDVLAKQFDASITPVREALKLLQAEGLLEAQPHRGVRVAQPNVDEIASIYVMRRLVEPHAARRAARRLSRRDYDIARRLNEEYAAASSQEQARRARQLNHDFHFVVYNACGLPTLVAEIERLWTGFPWATLQVRRGRQNSYDEHLRMLEALIADDQPAIQQLFESHITRGFASLMEHIDPTRTMDPFDDESPLRP
ncbi:GntR family transcriptional regulator [Conexibacter sp. CPCC 206217]|uniref:GntR family transcriptional regulator n=1 Tax=Conexibacter sp. CPCC 206217 TaxID=3064574 RepID=UPI00271A0D57|nr:GntR family transcriptional regulator [Conexibacter sp. CPCC 206217]MDO8211658.1 GntR family transcriptional regulator [Conexibacter sp. CPCC 206217]